MMHSARGSHGPIFGTLDPDVAEDEQRCVSILPSVLDFVGSQHDLGPVRCSSLDLYAHHVIATATDKVIALLAMYVLHVPQRLVELRCRVHRSYFYGYLHFLIELESLSPAP